MDQFRDTRKEFHDKMASGEADPSQFDRYIYGQFGSRSRYDDGMKAVEDTEHQIKREIERDVRERVRMEQEKTNLPRSQ